MNQATAWGDAVSRADTTSDGCRPQRVAVVGTTGSGKTTLARQISTIRGIPHIELDALHWGPDWTPTPIGLFRDRTAQALSEEFWVVDGNYSKVRDIVWGRADAVVWMDFSLPVIMGRLIWRTFSRIFTREELWSGNRERLWDQLFTSDSLFLYAFRTYRRRRREYAQLLGQPEHAHLTTVHLPSPHAARQWLAGLAQ